MEDATGDIIKQELYEGYKRWCDDNMERPVGQRIFKEALLKIFPAVTEWRKKRGSGPWTWKGVTWSDDGEPYKGFAPR